MGKKKRKSNHRKSGKCPEPFNTLIDLGAGIAMSALAGRKEEKHGYSKKGQINPYAASAVGFGLGKINSTEDIIRMGGSLGVLGAFDHIMGTSDDDIEISNQRTAQSDDKADETYGVTSTKRVEKIIAEDSIKADDGVTEISEESSIIMDEDDEPISFDASEVVKTESATVHHAPRNTWRKYCRDGTVYGLDPNDFDTADEYEDALRIAKNGTDINDQERDFQDMDVENKDDDHVDVEPGSGAECAKQVEKSRKYYIDIESMVKSKDVRATKGDGNKYCWRKYCESGSEYGINPEDYETADDYAEALKVAKNGK